MPKHITHYLDELEKELNSRGDTPELSLDMTPNLNNRAWGIKKKKLTLIEVEHHKEKAPGLYR